MAPIDVKLRSVALVIVASAAATALLERALEVVIRIEDLKPIGELLGE